jgi:hypothetical protein
VFIVVCTGQNVDVKAARRRSAVQSSSFALPAQDPAPAVEGNDLQWRFGSSRIRRNEDEVMERECAAGGGVGGAEKECVCGAYNNSVECRRVLLFPADRERDR